MTRPLDSDELGGKGEKRPAKERVDNLKAWRNELERRAGLAEVWVSESRKPDDDRTDARLVCVCDPAG